MRIWPFGSRKPAVRQAPTVRPRVAARSGYMAPYYGAQQSRLFEDWFSSEITSVEALRRSLPILRRRSRDLARNNDYARRFMQIAEDNIVGPAGIKLQVRATNPDGRPDEQGNDIIETQWRRWGRRGETTMCGRFSWQQVQRLAVRYMIRDGEAIIRMVEDRASAWGFRLQFIDPECFDDRDGSYDGQTKAGTRRYLGVEVNDYFRPVRYHFRAYSPYSAQIGHQYALDAGSVLHLYIAEYQDQVRGVPWLASAMSRLQMLGEYEEAELVAARLGAAKMGFYKSSSDTPADAVDDEGRLLKDIEPGIIEQMPADFEFQAFDPQHPTTAFGDFEKAILRGIASGIGAPYVDLANDLEGVNYSSIRQGELAARDHWRALQAFLSESMCQPTYERWLAASLSRTAFGIPMDRYEKFNVAQWQPRGWQWVDPEKEVNAAKLAIEAGLKTRAQVLAEQGLDFADTVRELARESEMLREAGLVADDLNRMFEAYGVAVRAGVITPQPDDEAHYRQKVDLPPMSPPTVQSWSETGGVKRPITLQGVEAPPQPPPVPEED